MPTSRPALGASVFSALQSSLSHLSSVLLTSDCRLCGELLTSFSRLPVCESCLGRVRPLEALAWCQRCQEPISLAAMTSFANESPRSPIQNGKAQGLALPDRGESTAGGPYCGPCRAGETKFDLLRSFGSYDAELRALLVLFKYEGVRTLAKPLGGWLRLALEHYPEISEVDAIVPVPLYPRRRRARGFNQAELLARSLQSWSKIPLKTGWLQRVKDTPTQTGLTIRQRAANMRGAFLARKKLDKRRIILIDDICTTGATLNACAGVLKRAGAGAVYGLTVARVVQEIEELWQQAS